MQGDNRGIRAGLSDRRVPMTHVSLILTPDLKRGPTTSAIYGLSAGECYAVYDRESRCLKTCEGFLPLPEENGKANSSMGFCRTFTSAGTLLNGRLYRLRTPARRTCGNGCGLLPTPSANKTTKSGEIVNADGTPWDGTGKPHSKTKGRPIQTALADYAMMFPTPKAGGNRNSRNAIIGKNTGGRHKSDMGLEQAVEVLEGILPRELETAEELPPRFRKIFPTPKASDYKGVGPYMSKLHQHDVMKMNLRGVVMEPNGGQLNPQFVAWLMGYPLAWADTRAEFALSLLKG